MRSRLTLVVLPRIRIGPPSIVHTAKHRRVLVRNSRRRFVAAGTVILSVVAVASGLTIAIAPANAQNFITDRTIVSDNLNRVSAQGWGSAQTGGKYSYSFPASFSSNGTAGVAAPPRPGSSVTATLSSTSALDAIARTAIVVPALPTGGNGLYAGLRLRSTTTGFYLAQVRIAPDGTALVSTARVDAKTGAQVKLSKAVVAIRGVTAGTKISLEFRTTGRDPVSVAARAWRSGSNAPAWQTVVEDLGADRLQQPGSIGLWSYVSSASSLRSVAFDEVTVYSLKIDVPTPSGKPTGTPSPTPPPTQTAPALPLPTPPTPGPPASSTPTAQPTLPQPPISAVPRGAVDYSSLGELSSITAALGAVSVGKEVYFPEGIYGASNFDSNNVAIFPTANVRGILGAGSAKTIFELVPRSSTRAALVPAQSTAPTGTNQLYVMRVGGYGPNSKGVEANVPVHLADFAIRGTDQGHLYNGLMLHYADNSLLQRMKITGIPGDNNANPGETFGIGVYRSNNVTVDGTEIDGRNAFGARDGSSLIGLNMVDGFTLKNSYLHDTKFGASVTAFHSTGNLVYENSRFEDNNVVGLNFEGNNANITIADCSFARTPWAHIILDAINYGASSKVTITDPTVEGKPVSATNKLRITSHTTTGQRQLRSDVHLFVNGVEHPEFIQWQKQNVGE
jgi:hypothetical protein